MADQTTDRTAREFSNSSASSQNAQDEAIAGRSNQEEQPELLKSEKSKDGKTKDVKPSRLKAIWGSLGLDVPTFLMMFK